MSTAIGSPALQSLTRKDICPSVPRQARYAPYPWRHQTFGLTGGVAVSTTGTVRMIFCVKESTGTDLGAIFQSVVNGLSQLPPVLSSEIPVTQVVQAVPGLVDAIDAARSDPDNPLCDCQYRGRAEQRHLAVGRQ